MNENMAHFQKKIEEMQRKLKLINDNIEDIKSGRIAYEEKKERNKNHDYMQNNIKKKNHLKMINNNSINFFNKKADISDFNSITNNRNSHYKHKNSFSNNYLMNNNIPKNTYFTNHKLNLNNEQKYNNCAFENCKNETPKFVRNNSYYQKNTSKEYQFNINKNYKNMRKINSASEIINSISIIKNHNKLKKYFKTKTNKNKLLNKNTLDNINDYNHSNNNTEKSPLNKAKTQYNKSIDNSRIKIALKKNYFNCQKNNNNKHKRNSNTIDNNNILNYNYNNSIQSNISNRSYSHKIIKKENKNKNKSEQILFDIINLTNEYNKYLNISKCKLNKDNILNAYKLLLFNNKIKDEFIFKIINMYNKNNKLKFDINNIYSFTPILNWIKINSNINQENDIYKNLCFGIMDKYGLENIEQLQLFIQKLFKKVNNNEYFLEGIKKILLP